MRPITDRLSPVIKLMVIVDALLYFFYILVQQSKWFFESHLALNSSFLEGELWQPLTALFVHVDFLSFAFNMIGLWFMGATIERQLGTRRFLMMFFATGVLSNVVTILLSVWTGHNQLYAGCANAVLALFVAFGTLYDRTQARVLGGLTLEARVLALILVGFAVLASATRGAWPSLAGILVAVLIAYVMSGGRGDFAGRLWGGLRAKRVRRRYQVLEGGRGGKRPQDLN
jgi:membrane associated rhomboid family serine protease